MEEWRDVEGFPGYQVSSLGRVKSLDRNIKGHRKGKECMIHIKERILKGRLLTVGYLSVQLYNGDCIRDEYIHRLVAEAFLPKEDGKDTVDHIDNTQRQNNNVSNLRWADRTQQAVNKTLTVKSNTGHRNIRKRSNQSYLLEYSRYYTKINKTFKTLEEAIAYRDSLT